MRLDQANEQGVRFFNNVWNYSYNGELDWSFHFLYLIAHIRGHFISGGVGFRQFLDVAILTQKCNLDWKWLKQNAEEIGIDKFLVTVLGLNEVWFGVKSPIDNLLSKEFVENATKEIFENGVFGNKSVDMMPQQMIFSGERSISTRLVYFIKQAFPSYRAMAMIPYCSYIIKFKALLPFAWIHRGIYQMTDDRSRKDFFARTISSRKGIDKLENWGLLK